MRFRFLVLLMFFCSAVKAQISPVEVSSVSEELSIQDRITIFYDAKRLYRIDSFVDNHNSQLFSANLYHIPFSGSMNGKMWVKLIVANQSIYAKHILIKAKYELFKSFYFNNGACKTDSAGIKVAAAKGAARNVMGLQFHIPGNSIDTIIFEITGSYLLRYRPGNNQIQMSIIDYSHNESNAGKDTLFFGFAFGFLFIAVIFMFIVYLTYKLTAFFWFVSFLSGMGVFLVATYQVGAFYLWPNVADGERSFILQSLSYMIAPASIVQFVRKFFRISEFWPRVDKMLLVVPALIILTHVSNLFLKNELSLSFIGSFLTIILVTVSYFLVFLLALRRVRYAGIMVISFTCLMLGVVFSNLIITGVVKWDYFLVKYVHIGGILCCSFSVIYVIFRYLVHQRTEKEDAQKNAIAALQQNEILIKDANVVLEKKVAERTQELSEEKRKSEELLHNILPVEIAEELKLNGRSKARLFENVSVMFTDFYNFTGISEKMQPEELVSELDYCFRNIDAIIEKHGLEKIKTLGDAYMAAGGLPIPMSDHAIKVATACIDILKFMQLYKVQRENENRPYFEMRVGINSGPVIAGIVGSRKFVYDIWGDTVNTAARMEQNSEVGKINISGTTYALIKEQVRCVHRGKIAAKNKGEIDMYFIEA